MHPADPSVQQPHDLQRHVSALSVYLTTVTWSRTNIVPTPNKPCKSSAFVGVTCVAFEVLWVAADPNIGEPSWGSL